MFRNPYADGLIILLIVLLFVGPKRLPLLGRSLGQGLKEFKDGITGQSQDTEEPRELNASPSASSPTERSSAEVGSEQRS